MTTALAVQSSNLLAKLEGHEAHAEVAALVRQNQELESMLESVKAGRPDIRVLAGQECFIKTDSDGIMQGFRGVVELSYREGKIYTVDAREEDGQWVSGFGKNTGPMDPLGCAWHATGPGTADLAGVMSVNVIRERDDPPEWNADRTKILRLTFHMLAVGRDKAGNWRVERLTLPFVMQDEFLETLAAKSKQRDFSQSIRFGIKRDFLDDNKGKLPKAHKWESLDGTGDDEIGFLCDISQWQVRNLFLTKATRNKNAAKKAQTVAKRLILSSWFGLGRLPVIPRGNDIVARIPVFGYRSPMDQTRLLALSRHVNAGKAIADFRFDDGNVIDVRKAEVSEEQVTQAVQEEAEISEGESAPEEWGNEPSAPEAKPVAAAPEPEAKPEPEIPPVEQQARDAVVQFDGEFGEDSALDFLGGAGVDLTAVLDQGADETSWMKILQALKVEAAKRRG